VNIRKYLPKKRWLAAIAGVSIAFGASGATYVAVAATTSAPAYCVTYGPSGTTSATGNNILYNWDHTTCPAGTYGITPPAGAKGATGPAGPAGPEGTAGGSTAGPDGLNVVYVFSSSACSSNGLGCVQAAVCPSAEPYLLGGGGSASLTQLTQSEPISAALIGTGTPPEGTVGNGWQVRAVPNIVEGTDVVSATAICSR
jgi:hypothetical protein